MCAIEFGDDNPGRRDAEEQDTEIEPDADEVIGIALGLHTDVSTSVGCEGTGGHETAVLGYSMIGAVEGKLGL